MANAIYFGDFHSKEGVYVTEKDGLHFRRFARTSERLKAAADQSGNPKIYDSRNYSQEFLRSLIPSGR